MAVEIGPSAELLLDPRFTRRLVQLELSELELPAPATATGHRAALFFRVIKADPASLRVELWERGSFHGARNISVSSGAARLHARRIALAAAELARRLRHVRLQETRRLAEARKRSESTRTWEPDAFRFFVEPKASFVAVGPDELWLVGPGIKAGWGLGRSHLGVGVSIYGGETTEEPSHAVQWTELALAPGYALPLTPNLRLDLGFDAAAAVVRLHGVDTVDDIEGQQETWTSRVAGKVDLELSLSRSTALGVSASGGAVLRRVPATLLDGSRRSYGGLWLAAEIMLVLTPGT